MPLLASNFFPKEIGIYVTAAHFTPPTEDIFMTFALNIKFTFAPFQFASPD
jgi:hypothetical protein